MYGTSDPTAAERTAFRRAEKQYKLYKTLNVKGRSRSRSGCRPSSGEGGGADLSAVVDFHALLAADGELPDGIGRRECPGFDRPVFCFLDRPGFYFIPGALSTEEQCCWIRESLKTFPQPPNRTNLTAIYGSISDLLIAAENQQILVEAENPDIQERNKQNNCGGKTESKYFKFVDSESQKGEEHRSNAATTLVRKLRWSTLGLQFDWSKRNYDVSLPHNKIPGALASLAKKMAIPAMPSGEEFKPEAAIVNYYGPSDMLGGHVDDMEADWTKPIVSISLGCKCIFLLGGKTRDEVPTAMFLRSGDIVLMAGEARERFHGVPRIFTESDQQEIPALISQLSSGDDVFILEYIKNSRININIRQVY
ncbi:Alpha-ketoglutarate-dependent dioxygenase alkB [Zea mays]|uniref:Alpha-ketoglutarate-dependent dioxygenase alkB n=1 Tax=Zea mays TaxID=4577 RepID=A0A3L6F8P2_MAIZE|nr:Alpha-ketoglutarate-dependent dioxygenase alkB [Zea mays]